MQKVFYALLFSTFLYADNIGGEISIALHNHSIEGSSSYNSLSTVELSDTLDFSSTQDVFFKAYIEHPFPLLPNIKLGYNTFSYDASAEVTSFSWGDIQNFTGTINNSLSLTYVDATLYYELLDNWAEMDTGLTFRYLNGDMGVEAQTIGDSASYSMLLPMLYAKLRFNIPSTDLSLQTEAHLIHFSDISIYDYEISARYSFVMGMGIEAGYKSFHLESDDLVDGLSTDIGFSGPYVSAIWDF